MLGVLCARHKPWTLGSISFFAHSIPASQHSRAVCGTRQVVHFDNRRRQHSTACNISSAGGGAASIWHAILPSTAGAGRRCDCRRRIDDRKPGEGSWNAAWDERPARWLHRADSAWLLFGVCDCLASTDLKADAVKVVEEEERKVDDSDDLNVTKSCDADDINVTPSSSSRYKVTGVLADGRCLFRALAHGACLKSGEQAPDDDRQRELADELRAQVNSQLLNAKCNFFSFDVSHLTYWFA